MPVTPLLTADLVCRACQNAAGIVGEGEGTVCLGWGGREGRVIRVPDQQVKGRNDKGRKRWHYKYLSVCLDSHNS